MINQNNNGITFTLEHIDQAASIITNQIAGHSVVCFYGTMGAGKTTLIKAICRNMGVNDVVASPTFALINEYRDAKGKPIYHFDLYRINKIEEVYDFGYEEYFFGNQGLCLIEWPELIEDLLPDNTIKISILANPDSSRYVKVMI